MIIKLFKILVCFVFFMLSAWGAGALYYSERLPDLLNIILTIGFVCFSLLCIKRIYGKKRKNVVFIWFLLFIAIVWHWTLITPSHDRIWRADMARMPYAVQDGDTVTLFNYRDFQYRSLDDFTPNYKERTVQLSHLTSVDYFISYWQPGPVAHTFVSFNFDNAPPVCISIEARYEEHEGFDPLASMFRKFELIYVTGSEQDIVGVRTNYRHEDVYMYQIEISPEHARQLFLVYLDRINQLYEKPEFYNLLSNSCTINIVRYANKLGRTGRLDIRLVLNGYSDRYLYNGGYLDTTLPFAETRERAYINPLAQQTDLLHTFSEKIRQR